MTCVRSGNNATLSSSLAISSSACGWRNTGRANVASVMNRSHGSVRTAGRSGPVAACSRRSPRPGCRANPSPPARCRAHGRRGPARAWTPPKFERLAVFERLLRLAGAAFAHAHVHQRDGLGAGEDCAVTGSRVIGMGMGDDGPRDGARRGRRRSRPARSTGLPAGPGARSRGGAFRLALLPRPSPSPLPAAGEGSWSGRGLAGLLVAWHVERHRDPAQAVAALDQHQHGLAVLLAEALDPVLHVLRRA